MRRWPLASPGTHAAGCPWAGGAAHTIELTKTRARTAIWVVHAAGSALRFDTETIRVDTLREVIGAVPRGLVRREITGFFSRYL